MFAWNIVIFSVIVATSLCDSNVDFRVSGDCATNHDVGRNDVIRLLVLEAENSSSCTVNVSATADGACQKLCYIFSQNSFIKNTNVTFTVENSTSSQVYDHENFIPKVPMCPSGTSLSVTLTLNSDYVYDEDSRGFHVIIRVYHECGQLGTVENIEFSDAVKHAKGYYHGPAKQEQESKTYVHGLIVGLSLAGIFLILLISGICYTHCSPKN